VPTLVPPNLRLELQGLRRQFLSHWDTGKAFLGKVRVRGGAEAQRALGRLSAALPPSPHGGLCGAADALPLTAENLMLGYCQGLFPMDFGGRLRWHCPHERFVLRLSELRLSPNMRRDLRQAAYNFTLDRAPREVLAACADRPEGTWLSVRLQSAFMDLLAAGVMHTVEAWDGDKLVGGSFGLAVGRVWTGETMFHRAPNAGKAQFVFLAEHLLRQGYECVDGQAYSPHFARFGARHMPIDEYRTILARGLMHPAKFSVEAETEGAPAPIPTRTHHSG
jgi:leucyl/phenylalanyl-tRNA--protein transferase